MKDVSRMSSVERGAFLAEIELLKQKEIADIKCKINRITRRMINVEGALVIAQMSISMPSEPTVTQKVNGTFEEKFELCMAYRKELDELIFDKKELELKLAHHLGCSGK